MDKRAPSGPRSVIGDVDTWKSKEGIGWLNKRAATWFVKGTTERVEGGRRAAAGTCLVFRSGELGGVRRRN